MLSTTRRWTAANDPVPSAAWLMSFLWLLGCAEVTTVDLLPPPQPEDHGAAPAQGGSTGLDQNGVAGSSSGTSGSSGSSGIHIASAKGLVLVDPAATLASATGEDPRQ